MRLEWMRLNFVMPRAGALYDIFHITVVTLRRNLNRDRAAPHPIP